MFMLFGTIHEKPVNFFLFFCCCLALLCFYFCSFALSENLFCFYRNVDCVHITQNKKIPLVVLLSFSLLFSVVVVHFFFFCFLFANFFLSICFHFFVFVVPWAVLHLIVCSCCCENNAVVRKVFEIRNFNVFNESQAYTYIKHTNTCISNTCIMPSIECSLSDDFLIIANEMN